MTERQQAVLDALRSFREQHGYSPTVRELAAVLERDPAGVQRIINALRREGRVEGRARTLKPT